METFDIIKSDVLQGSKVVLDVEEEGLDERTILSLDAATKISSSGSTCFHSSDGKEHCFAEAQTGECSSFADPEGRRQLWSWFKKAVKAVESTADKAKRLATDAANAAKAEAGRVAAAAKAEAERVAREAAAAAQQAQATANNSINSMKAIALGPVYQASVDVINNAMKSANVVASAWDDIEAGAKIAAEGYMVGVMEVAKAGVWLAEWVNAHQCELGMSSLLGALFAVNIVNPLPVGIAVSTTYLRGVAIAYLADPSNSATKDQVLIACDMVAQYYLEMIWSNRSVENSIGESNKEVLQNAIAMTVHKNFEKAAAAFVFLESGAAIIAGVTVNLAARVVCYDQLPKGAAEWGK